MASMERAGRPRPRSRPAERCWRWSHAASAAKSWDEARAWGRLWLARAPKRVVVTVEPSLLRGAVHQARASHAAAVAGSDRTPAQQLVNLARAYERAQTLLAGRLIGQPTSILRTPACAWRAPTPKRSRERSPSPRSARPSGAQLALHHDRLTHQRRGALMQRRRRGDLAGADRVHHHSDLTRKQVDASADVGKTGMTASVTVVSAERSDAVRTPAAALRFVPTGGARSLARPWCGCCAASEPSRCACAWESAIARGQRW